MQVTVTVAAAARTAHALATPVERKRHIFAAPASLSAPQPPREQRLTSVLLMQPSRSVRARGAQAEAKPARCAEGGGGVPGALPSTAALPKRSYAARFCGSESTCVKSRSKRHCRNVGFGHSGEALGDAMLRRR
eukprot:4040646-Pleurochrysis_carterae.AAC.1